MQRTKLAKLDNYQNRSYNDSSISTFITKQNGKINLTFRQKTEIFNPCNHITAKIDSKQSFSDLSNNNCCLFRWYDCALDNQFNSERLKQKTKFRSTINGKVHSVTEVKNVQSKLSECCRKSPNFLSNSAEKCARKIHWFVKEYKLDNIGWKRIAVVL